MHTANTTDIPLSLYVHIPWCVKKCPYCDFNSHVSQAPIPEQQYTEHLIADLAEEAKYGSGRRLSSIFFGGGTPSLFSPQAIGRIIHAAQESLGFTQDIEITLEANPGTTEYTDFGALRDAGVNRLSIGIQTFNTQHLKALGRIHSEAEAINAFHKARAAGFNNVNLDLMHGLPNQSQAQAMLDLTTAIELQPEHISWYQLTIEPNTIFYNAPPALPNEDTLSDIQDQGEALLAEHGYQQYEVSAYAKNNLRAKHNMNYWQFGDYLGIGAGAHGKITTPDGHIERYRKTRLPADYLNADKAKTVGRSVVPAERLPLEFMMNALRLPQGIETQLFQQRTGLPLATVMPQLQQLQTEGLIEAGKRIRPTTLGFRFLNTVLSRFNEEA